MSTWVERIAQTELENIKALDKFKKKEQKKKPPPEETKEPSPLEKLFPDLQPRPRARGVESRLLLDELMRQSLSVSPLAQLREEKLRQFQPIGIAPLGREALAGTLVKTQARPPVFQPSLNFGREPFMRAPRPLKATPMPSAMPSLTWLDKVIELKDNPVKLVPFVSSGVEIFAIGKLLKTALALEADREVSREDLLALKEYVDRSQRDTDWSYKFADVLTQMVPWGLEFLATGGVYAIGSKAAIKGGTLALKRIATKTGAKILERKLAQYGLKLAGTVAGGTLRTIPIALTKAPAATLEKQLVLTLTGDEEAVWKSAVKSLGEQWVEVVSESTGGLFKPLTAPIKGQLVKLGIFKAFQAANPAQSAGNIKRVVEGLGYHGILEEMLEERVADVGHGILAQLGLGNQKFKLPSLEQLSVELAAFSIPGVAMKAVESMPWKEIIAGERGGIKLPGKVPKPARPLIEAEKPAMAKYYRQEAAKWREVAIKATDEMTKEGEQKHAYAIQKAEAFEKAASELAIPEAEAGMPEAGYQPAMIEGVTEKEVRPAGKGKIVQISMEEQLKLEQARRVAEEAPEEYKDAYYAQAEIEGLKATHATDPVAQARFRVPTATKKGYKEVGLDFFISIREGEFPSYLTVKQAEIIAPYPVGLWSRYTQKGLRTYNKVPTDAVLDELADKWGMTSDQIRDRVLQIRQEKAQLKRAQDTIKRQMTRPLAAVPELTPEEVAENWATIGQPKLTMEQIDVLILPFAEYILNPNTVTAMELTRQLQSQELSRRFENLKGRAQELIVSEGITTERALKQSISETLSGKLPVVMTDYLDAIVGEMRDAHFAKVYHTFSKMGKEYQGEMVSTITALTNALTGRPIPRKRGTGSILFPEGGSAWDRLNFVFGKQPKVIKALNKIASEKKPLKDVVAGIFHETGREPIPIDQETADYLRGLSEIPFGYKTTFEPPFNYPTVADLREPAELKYALRKLELGTQLAEGKLTKDAYDLAMLEAKNEAYPYPPVTHYEFPIENAIKQITYWPTPVRDAVIRMLKELAWSPVDIGNFLRAMKSSVDMSYWRQIMPLIPGHPIRFAKSNVDAWAGTISGEKAQTQWENITKSPLYAIYDALQAKQGRDFLRPLDLAKGVAQWKGVEEYGYLTKNRLIPRLTAQIPTVKWSNRGFVSGCNSHSWGIFEDFYKLMLRKSELYASGQLTLKPGESLDIMEAMDAEATKLADWTGRASLGKLAPAAPAIASVIYAPRYGLGRMIGPRHLFSSNPYVRKEAWKDAALFVGVIGGLMLLGRQFGWWDIEAGKIKIGKLRIDPWGGALQFARFFQKVVYIMAAPVTGKPAKGISTTTGEEYPLDFWHLTESFIKSKEAPLAAAFLEYVTGKTYGGEKVDIKNLKQWADRIVPMSIQDIYESIMEQPSTVGIAGILSFTGFGVQTYPSAPSLFKKTTPEFKKTTPEFKKTTPEFKKTTPEFKKTTPEFKK